jgi:hypothetical protein
MQFIQEWAIPSLSFVEIERFHPLKRVESIAKYSFKKICLAFERNFAQKKNASLDQGIFCVFLNVEILAPLDYGKSIFWRHSNFLVC